MIANLQPYPEYKESGLSWIGRLPAHWEVRRMKSAVANAIEQTSELTSDDVYVALEHVESWTGHTRPQRGRNLFTGQVKRFQPDDVLFGKLRPYLAKVTRLPVQGVCVGEFFVLRMRASDLIPAFLEQQLRAKQTIDVINSSTFGAKMPRADWQFVGNLPIAIPPPEEQTAIVRFLDYANGRLERAIRAKRKVIALLNEQKQAIIHRAVTRGLDPTVPLKPSGIPWLGDIPEHWEVRPLKQLLARMDYGTSENGRGEGRVRMLTMGHIRDGKIVFPEKGSLDSVPQGLLLENNDLLFNRTNSPELVGKVGLFAGDTSDEITFASYLVRLRVRSEHSPFWLNYLLNSMGFWSYARSQALVSLHQANLNSTRYGQMVLPVPNTRAEQDKIVEQIRLQAGEVERAITRLEREIALLREYRTRLVADVVTGKLDVREVARQLPVEAAEVEAAPDTEELSEPEPGEIEA